MGCLARQRTGQTRAALTLWAGGRRADDDLEQDGGLFTLSCTTSSANCSSSPGGCGNYQTASLLRTILCICKDVCEQFLRRSTFRTAICRTNRGAGVLHWFSLSGKNPALRQLLQHYGNP